MSLLGQELRKIRRPGVLAGIALLGLIYYYMFPSFYIEYFSNGPAAASSFTLSADWTARYGPTLEPEERRELDGQLTEEKARFIRQLQEIPEAGQAGVTDYESFRAFSDRDERDTQTIWTILDHTNYDVIRQIEQVVERYDAPPRYEYPGFESVYTPKEQARIIETEHQPYSLLPDTVMDSTNYYFKYLTQWTAISVILLLSPTLVRDRLRRMRPFQWSTRRGRRVLHTQFAAGLLSGLALSAGNLIVYMIPFLLQRPLVFRDCPLSHSVWAVGTPWFDWTYGQYLAVLSGMALSVGLGAGAVTLFLSQYSEHYVSMLLKAFPLFIVIGGFFAPWVMDNAFFFRPLWDYAETDMFQGAEAFCIGALLTAGAALMGWSLLRQKQREC